MIKISKNQLHKIVPLFIHHQYNTVLLNTILEGHHGEVVVDNIENPTIARLDSGNFTFLGGDPKCSTIKELLHSRPIRLITPENQEWNAVLQEEFAGKISSIEFTECYSNSVNTSHLNDFIDMMPSDYSIKLIDKNLAERIADDFNSDYFSEHFSGIDDFIYRGIGYCILNNNQIVSAAISTASCKNAIDVEIKTNSDYQRTGLGTIIGAYLVKACLEKNIDPKWLAANDRSTRLAEKLGYTKGQTYSTLSIDD